MSTLKCKKISEIWNVLYGMFICMFYIWKVLVGLLVISLNRCVVLGIYIVCKASNATRDHLLHR